MKTSKHILLFLSLFLSVAIFSCDKEDSGDETPIDNSDQTRRRGLVAKYSVAGNNITLIQSGPASKGFFNESRQKEFWSFFTSIIPAEARSVMKELELFADPEDGTAAYVAPLDQNNLSVWEMGHNLDFVWDNNNQFVKAESAYTSIHEVAHLLTLDHTQVDVNGNNCGTFHTGEGCSNSGSYINQFFSRFWGDIYQENQQIGQDDLEGYAAFYRKYRDRFVSEYAATNPGEDIAESFATYVVGDVPTGNSVASQKIRFFDSFQELVALKQKIKANINFDVNLNNIRGVRSQRFMAQKGGKANL